MMKLKLNPGLAGLLLVIGVFLSAPLSAGYVDLKITGTGAHTKLEIEDSDVKCGSDKNCIKTVKGQALDLDFRLKKACQNNGPVYRLSEMILSMVQKEPENAGSDVMVKAFEKYVMPAIVTSDFGTDATGKVLWNNHNSLADDKIKIKNKNEGAYVVFYQIKASKCPGSNANGPAHIYLDPKIRNTGK
jgi:hypothetical protein